MEHIQDICSMLSINHKSLLYTSINQATDFANQSHDFNIIMRIGNMIKKKLKQNIQIDN